MGRSISFLCLFFLANLFFAQTDTSKITTPETNTTVVTQPVSSIPTNTPDPNANNDSLNSPPELTSLKPKVALGTGMLSFFGDMYGKHYQSPWTARVGFDLNISQRLTGFLQLNFNVMFGKLGAFENLPNRHENFQSEIRAGGVNVLYDFGHLIPVKIKLRPWISLGVAGFEFLSKTDLYDKTGQQYFYWSDGSIKNMAEGSAGSQNAKDLVRDYVYETDVRERNIDGFGKYPERAWAMPLGAGVVMKVTDRVDLKIGTQFYFTTTDYIDGITNKSVGNRIGTKAKDNFVYTSFSLQYDLIYTKKGIDTLPNNYYDGIDWLAIDNGDYDKDGVKDFDDNCQCTPSGVKVDAVGCELDDDKDNVPNYRDDENPSPKGFEVNARGVALTDEYWQEWYDNYNDSLGQLNFTTDVLGNIHKEAPVIKKKKEVRIYTVELARYKGGVPSDEMAYLLSIGDIKSTTLEDGTTVVYTAGIYDNVKLALQRRDEYRAEGNKQAKIGYFKEEKYYDVSDEELASLANNTSVNTNTTTTKIDTAKTGNPPTENFAKGEIVYRVQLGSYKHRMNLAAFKNASGVIELQTPDAFRYVSKGCKTIAEAAAIRADFVLSGYPDAFITAYKDGKRIAMNKTAATMVTKEKEDLSENKTFSSVDKTLVAFKIQIGALVKPNNVGEMDDRVKEGKITVEKQNTATGSVRFVSGNFKDQASAEKFRKELEDKGFPEAFIIATFKNEIISIQEANDLLK